MVIPSLARWILQGVLAFLLIMVLVFLTIFGVNYANRLKAESLVKDIQTLRVDESTTADVQRIMNRHGGGPGQAFVSSCLPMDGVYSVATGSQTIFRLYRDVPLLKRFGLRPWNTGATVVLTKGRVCRLFYGVGMEDMLGQWKWGVQLDLVSNDEREPYEEHHAAYRVGTRDYKGIRSLKSELTPEATKEQRQRDSEHSTLISRA